jgi:hypothetical protein
LEPQIHGLAERFGHYSMFIKQDTIVISKKKRLLHELGHICQTIGYHAGKLSLQSMTAAGNGLRELRTH